jgi:Glycosyltransferase family 87
MNLYQMVSALVLLAVGVTLMLLAQRRNWRPSLAVALAVAAVLRVVTLVLTHKVEPYDLTNDFWAAAIATLHHHDPILYNRTNGWGSLPTYTFVLAGAAWTVVHLHWSWLVVARIPALLCDLGVVVVVGALVTASGGSAEQGALRRFQYACNPIAILVSSVHGQLEPACLLLAFSAMVVVLRGGPGISGRRALAGGALLGLAISTQSWPVLFGPALLIALPSWRRRLQAVAGGAAVGVVLFATMPLTVGTPLDKMPYLFKHMISNQPTIGTWGWAGVWVTQHQTALPVWSDPLWIHVAKIGTKVALVVALLAVFWWRRAHPLDVATVTTTALIVSSPAFGNQYLQWPVPSSIARPTRLTMPLQIVVGIYAAVFYLPLDLVHAAAWQDVDNGMMFFSLAVAAFMVIALPWHRRVWDRAQPPGPEDGDRVAVDVAVSDHI